jgi:hypothetical protein
MLRIELHAHTVYSPDGHIDFDRLVTGVRRNRLDAVAVTDHDTIEGALAYRERARRRALPFDVIVGEERTLADGTHLIGLFLREPIRSAELGSAVEEIRGQGGIVVVPHPFRQRDGIAARSSLQSLGGDIVVELFNPKCSRETNAEARLLLEIGRVGVGGSDAHYGDELGESLNLVPRAGTVEQSIREALGRGGWIEVWGIPQRAGRPGRQYAPLYYRLKPWFRAPRPLLPLANRAYARYRDMRAARRPATLERKYP